MGAILAISGGRILIAGRHSAKKKITRKILAIISFHLGKCKIPMNVCHKVAR